MSKRILIFSTILIGGILLGLTACEVAQEESSSAQLPETSNPDSAPLTSPDSVSVHSFYIDEDEIGGDYREFVPNTMEAGETPASTETSSSPTSNKTSSSTVLQPRKRNLSWCPEKAVPTQRYTLASEESHIFRGNSGTLIQVPQHAFVDKKTGKPIKGEVTLLLREAYTKADLIKSGLSTRAGKKLLRSGGVIEINAEANGRPCVIAEGKELYVEFVSPDAYGDMRLWSGTQDEAGYLNWEEVAQAHKDMALFPLDLLDLSSISRSEEAKRQDSIRRASKVYRRTFQDQLEEKLRDPFTQSSWLATREFRDRLIALRELGEGYDFADHYVKDQHGRLVEKDKKVLMELSNLRRTHEEGHGSGHLTALIEQYERFVAQDKGNAEIIPTYDFDLGAPDARDKMIAQGVPPHTADRQIAVHERTQFLQEEFAKNLAAEEKAAEKRNSRAVTQVTFAGMGLQENRGFSLQKLGLFNCDAPPTFRKPVTMGMSLIHDDPKVRAYSRCYIVIQGNNSFAELKHEGNGKFKEDNLPGGRRSTVVGLSYVDGVHYLAKAETRIGEASPDLIMRPVNTAVLERALASL